MLNQFSRVGFLFVATLAPLPAAAQTDLPAAGLAALKSLLPPGSQPLTLQMKSPNELALSINAQQTQLLGNSGRLRAVRNSQELDLGFFGGAAAEHFTGGPEEHAAALRFGQLRKAEVLTGFVGHSALWADLIFITVRGIQNQDDRLSSTDLGVSLGLLFGGLALDVASRFCGDAAERQLTKAVALSNQRVVNTVLGATPAHSARNDQAPKPYLAQANFSF